MPRTPIRHGPPQANVKDDSKLQQIPRMLAERLSWGINRIIALGTCAVIDFVLFSARQGPAAGVVFRRTARFVPSPGRRSELSRASRGHIPVAPKE